MKINKNIFLCLLLFASFLVEAQELPPIKNFTPNVYGGENQNWDISQSEENYIYVANNSGLLEYNGAKWQLYPLPNNSIIRSVKVIDNKVYTGGYMEFGYWEKNEFGILTYQSLSNKIKDNLIEEDFWKIIKFDSFILFQSLLRIYIYDTEKETFKIINSEVSLPKLFMVEESIYFQKFSEGIFKIENGVAVLMLDYPILKDNILVNIYAIDDILSFQTQELGIYQYKNDKLSKWEIPANNVISNLSIYSSIQLQDGSIVIGSISDGIFHLDQQGNIINSINQEKGLNNNTVLSMFEDMDHNLWLGLDNGISVVNFNSPFSVYNDLKGNIGSVYASAIFNNKLYLGTNQGLFYRNIDSNEDFEFISETSGQVWCIKIIDNTLFCGHNSGTFIVSDDRVELVSNILGTWDIKPIANTGLLLQGNYNGLSILEKKGNNWQYRNTLEGFTISSRYFEIGDDNEVFVNHESNGVFKLKVDNDYSRVINHAVETSAPKSLKSGLAAYNNQIIYMSSEGIFNYNSIIHEFVLDDFLTKSVLESDIYISGKLINNQETNSLWGFSKENIVYFTPGKLDNTLRAHNISLPASLRKFLPGFESMTRLKDELYLFGTSRGYIQLDLNKLKDSNFKISINAIQKSILNNPKTHISLNTNTDLKSFENNLYFEFNVPEYNNYFEVNYKYQLEGLYNDWSDWSTNSSVSFENLPYGKYTFRVKAKIGNRLSDNTASYSLIIDRPWYFSNLFIGLYILLLFVTIIIVNFMYKLNFNKEKQKLLEKKQRVFAISQLENEQEIMKLKNEKLRQDVESKSRELGASTMSIIKKNEILNTIKDELTAIKDESHVKPVLKIIDKNLTNTGDWAVFKEAFNNADTDFLKKVKNAHPILTPNDLRLCAYLRLNLSSKEIAPLLNISPRSVEIKRYRLRKKMDLAHEKSLVEYILEL